jgi:hypothetical protein
MSRTSKRIVNDTVEALNDLLDMDPRAEALLDHSEGGLSVIDLVNAILTRSAEGATIVAARETDGALVGFVPKRQPKQKGEVKEVEKTVLGEAES